MTFTLQAIVFDFDGVIADSEPLHLRAFQRTLAADGLELSADDYYSQYLGYDDVGLFRALARDRQIPISDAQVGALVARKTAALHALLRDGHVLFPGAAEFIHAAAAEVPLAIASGALRHEIGEILDAADLAPLFSVIVAAGDTPESKPSPAPYLLTLERLRQQCGRDLDPRCAVAIEDSRWGLESAQKAGLRCVGVTTTYPAADLPGAELVVGGLKDLTLRVLDRLVATPPRATEIRGHGVRTR
jgi:HAD superfamily hydrolase (TIGR01509 family)